jgi:CubicO group peptidase (beta-lactamase class C family)
VIFNSGSCGKVLTGWGVMRLLSHTAGLTAPGFSDYYQRSNLLSLAKMPAGQDQTSSPAALPAAKGWS